MKNYYFFYQIVKNCSLTLLITVIFGLLFKNLIMFAVQIKNRKSFTLTEDASLTVARRFSKATSYEHIQNLTNCLISNIYKIN